MSIFNDKGRMENKVSVCPYKPIRTSRPNVSRQVANYGQPMSPFMTAYPKKCDTDEKRIEYLKKEFNNGEITMQVYADLVEVLELPDKVKFNDILQIIKGDKQ